VEGAAVIKLDSRTMTVLMMVSGGEIGLIGATALLEYKDAGYTLQALRMAGLEPFRLPDDVVNRQGHEALEALRSALKSRG
jgi:hypothetical protein